MFASQPFPELWQQFIQSVAKGSVWLAPHGHTKTITKITGGAGSSCAVNTEGRINSGHQRKFSNVNWVLDVANIQALHINSNGLEIHFHSPVTLQIWRDIYVDGLGFINRTEDVTEIVERISLQVSNLSEVLTQLENLRAALIKELPKSSSLTPTRLPPRVNKDEPSPLTSTRFRVD